MGIKTNGKTGYIEYGEKIKGFEDIKGTDGLIKEYDKGTDDLITDDCEGL